MKFHDEKIMRFVMEKQTRIYREEEPLLEKTDESRYFFCFWLKNAVKD